MSFQTTAPDIPLLVTVPSTSSKDKDNYNNNAPPQLSAERRISPSWTVSQFKAKLEPMTGIPPGCQDLRIRGLDGSWIPISGEERQVGEWGLRRGGEIEVHDTRPSPSLPPSSVEKYTMPPPQYAALPSTVLAWKKTHQLGRFDPSNPTAHELAGTRTAEDESEIHARKIAVGRRCRVGGDDARRGCVAFVGGVEGLGAAGARGARWVGVVFDEPVGRNDGGVWVGGVAPAAAGGDGGDGGGGRTGEMRRLFECKPGFGVVVRPDKVEVGDEWAPLDDLGVDEEMEEL